MYDKKRKNYPPFPDLLTCAILQLRKMEENDGIKFKNEKLFTCQTICNYLYYNKDKY